jgi:hypothetical protein
MTIFYINKKDFSNWIKTQNKNNIYAEDIQRYLDKESIKATTGLAKLAGVSNVLVDEDGTAKGLPKSRVLRYNEDYERTWGNVPLYGNVVLVLTDKAYKDLAEDKKTPLETIVF